MSSHLRIIELYESGKTIAEVATQLYYSQSYVYGVLRLYKVIDYKPRKTKRLEEELKWN